MASLADAGRRPSQYDLDVLRQAEQHYEQGGEHARSALAPTDHQQKSGNRYVEARGRHARYYLTLPQHLHDNMEQLKVEFPNIQRAFTWCLEVGYYELIIEFWSEIDDVLWDHGYWQEYLNWGQGALEAARQLSLLQTEAWALAALGWLRLEQGEFELAEELFRLAKEKFDFIGNFRGVSTIERYRGVLAYRIGEFDRASQHYEAALQLLSNESNTGSITSENQLNPRLEREGATIAISEIRNLQGSLARKMGDYARAREFYEESARLLRLAGNKWRLTAVLRNVSQLEFQLGNIEAAKRGLMKTIELCAQIDRKDMLHGCQLKLAGIERILGNCEEARALAVSARTGFYHLGLNSGMREAEHLLRELA